MGCLERMTVRAQDAKVFESVVGSVAVLMIELEGNHPLQLIRHELDQGTSKNPAAQRLAMKRMPAGAGAPAGLWARST